MAAGASRTWIFTCACYRHFTGGRVEVELRDDVTAADKEAALKRASPFSVVTWDDDGHLRWFCSPLCAEKDRRIQAALELQWKRAEELAMQKTRLKEPSNDQIWEAFDELYPRGGES